MGQKKRHHTIPEFYLRGFTSGKDNPSLWMYKRGGDKGICMSTENAAVQSHFYKYTSGTLGEQELEDLLAQIESIAAPIHRRVIDGMYPTDAEKADYSYFLATLYTRTSNAMVVHKKSMTELMNANKNVLADNPVAFEAFITDYEKSSGMKLDVDKEEFRKFYRATPLEVKADLLLFGCVVDHARVIAPLLLNMHWTLLKTRDDLGFVTSDNPVCVVDPARPDSDLFGIGFRSAPTVQVSCPISRDYALLATWSSVLYPHQGIASVQLVEEINRRTVMNSERFVFAAEFSDQTQLLVNRTRPMVPDVKVQVDPETGQFVIRSVRRSD